MRPILLTAFVLGLIPANAGDLAVETYVIGVTPQIDGALLLGGQARANAVLQAGGIRVDWKRGRPQSAPTGLERTRLTIEIVSSAPDSASPTALATTTSTSIRLFWDRLTPLMRTHPQADRAILGHVMAHEILHALEGPGSHEDEGLMKATWTREDLKKMQRTQLAFGPHTADER